MSIQGRTRVQQRLVDDWNRAHPVGTRVKVTLDNGDVVEDVTVAYGAGGSAELLGGHTACVKLQGRGCFLLSRCRPIAGPAVVMAEVTYDDGREPERWDGLS